MQGRRSEGDYVIANRRESTEPSKFFFSNTLPFLEVEPAVGKKRKIKKERTKGPGARNKKEERKQEVKKEERTNERKTEANQ